MDGTPLLGRLTGVGWYTYCLAEALAAYPEVDRVRLLPVTWRRPPATVPPSPRVELVRRPLPARPTWRCWRRVGIPPLDMLLRADIFHATNYLAPPAWRVPVVATVHDLWFLRHPTEVSAAERALAELLPPLLRRAAAVITVSEHTHHELLDWLPDLADRTTAVPLAPRPLPGPATPPAALPDPDSPFLLVLGTVNPRKNLPAALDALVEVRGTVRGTRLVLAGRVDPRVDLPGALRTRGLGRDAVVPLGYVSDREARWLLEHARLLLSCGHEGFGLPVLEAMAAGLPVVALARGAVPEVAGDAAAVVRAPEELGSAARRLLLDAGLRAELLARGRRRARAFSWAATASATLTVYRRALGSG